MPDAFDLLGIEPRFAIDAVELDRRHRDLLSQLHPDRNPAPDAPDAREAHAASLARLGDINDAYRIISDPIRRAEQLLSRRGAGPMSGDDPELLARIFEQREAVDNATDRSDTDSLSIYATAARKRQSALIEELTAFFEIEPARVSVPQKTQIARALEELRYLKKLIERAEQALDELL
jgi:molecular chaperone HscB